MPFFVEYIAYRKKKKKQTLRCTIDFSSADVVDLIFLFLSGRRNPEPAAIAQVFQVKCTDFESMRPFLFMLVRF